MKIDEDKNKKTKDLKISLVVFALITFFTVSLLFYLNKHLPKYVMLQGKKYLEIGHYEKALQLFEMAGKSMQYSCEPILYKAITYSKMPQNYENQKKLYEFSKSSDCDDVSEEVTKILNNMRNYYFKTSGESYIDNVLYKDKLIRWNNNEFITYYIEVNDNNVPKHYVEAIRRAFFNWQIATNSELKFKEVTIQKDAKILISFVNRLNNENQIGQTTPIFIKNSLSQMNIKIQKTNDKKKNYSNDTILSVAQHEVGHALGLWGHSANKEDVMFLNGDNSDEAVKVISPQDVNTVTAIYKMIPDVIDTPLKEEQKPYLYFHNILTTYPNKNFEYEINNALLKLKDDKPQIIQWISLVEEFQKAQQYERANFILLKLLPYIEKKEQKYIVLYNIAENYYKLKDYQNADKFINSALAINQQRSALLLNGILNIKLGKLDDALKKLTSLASQYPDDVEIALNLAKVYVLKGDKKNEKKVLKTLVKNNANALKDVRVLKYQTNKAN